jgi:hypothetical protein
MIALEEKASHQFQRSREGCKNLMAVKDIMSSGRERRGADQADSWIGLKLLFLTYLIRRK